MNAFDWSNDENELHHCVNCENDFVGNNVPVRSLRDIVDFMRKHEDHFREFAVSDSAKLFTPPVFENQKK